MGNSVGTQWRRFVSRLSREKAPRTRTTSVQAHRAHPQALQAHEDAVRALRRCSYTDSSLRPAFRGLLKGKNKYGSDEQCARQPPCRPNQSLAVPVSGGRGYPGYLPFIVEMQELETKEQLIVEEAYFDDPRLPETHRARPPTSTPSVVGGLVSHAGPSDAPTSTPTVVGGLVSKAGPSVVTTADDAARRTRVPIGNTYVNVLYMCQGQAQKRGAEGCCGMYLPPSLWGRSCSNM